MARGVAWNLVGVVFNQGSTFVVNVLLAHVLDVGEFGEYAMVQSTVQVAALLAQVATGYTATKYVAEFRAVDHDKTGRIIGLLGMVATGMAAIVGAALFAASGWLATAVLHSPHLRGALAIASGTVFLSALTGFLMGSLAGFERYKPLGVAGVGSGLTYIVFCLAGGTLWGLTGAVAGGAFSGLVQTLILWRAVRAEVIRQGIVVRVAPTRGEAGIILRFAIPAALNGFITMPAIWFGNAFLAQQASGYASFALFSAANSFRIIVLFLPNIMNNVSMSLINNQKGAQDERRYRRTFWFNLTATLGIVLVGAACVSILGRWLLSWFGPEFAAGYGVLLIMMAVTIPESISTALFQVIQSRERIWWSVGAVALPAFGTLAYVAWLLTPTHGAAGLAWAHLTCWIIALIASCAIVLKLGVRLPALGVAKAQG